MRTDLVGRCGLGLFTAAIFVAGCSSKDGDGGGAADGGASGSSFAVLAEHSFAVKTDPLSVSATSLTFTTNAEVQAFQVGDTLAPANAATALSTPYLGTVASIAVDSPAPGQTTFAITPASIDDLFSQADVDQTVAVTSGAANSVAPIDAGSPNILANPFGLPLGTSSPQTFMALPSGGKIFSLGSQGALSLSGNGTLDMSESSFAISGGVGFTYEKAPGLTLLPDHVRLVFTGGMNITVGAKITATGAVTYLFPSTPYGPDLVLGAIVVFAGPVPIPIVVSLAFAGSAQVALSGAATMHEAVSGAFQMSAGVDYTSSGGVTGVFDHQGLINYAPFTATGNYNTAFRLVPLLATLKFSLLGAVGPSVTVAPSVGIQISPVSDGGTMVVGTYGLATLLGGSLTIFDHTIAGLNLTLFTVGGTFPVCPAGSLVCSGGPIVAGK